MSDTGIDYKLVYEVRMRGFNTNEKRNLQIQYENKARAEADKVHQKYLDFLTNALGTDDFEVTNEMCMADGIIGHVFTPGSGEKGLGRRKCVFCGCDDFDGY
jgi:hypothetical protein